MSTTLPMMMALQIEPVSLVILAIGAIVAVPFCWYAVGQFRLANRLVRIQPDSVFDATDGGRIELRGTAEPITDGRLLRSPFTDTSCLVYEYAVEEYRSSNNGSSWQTVDSGVNYLPFLLRDDTGTVLIEPPGAEFRLGTDRRVEVDGGTEPPARIGRFIEATDAVDCQNTTLDLRVFELQTGNDRRFVERLLVPGEEVHILGAARYDTTVSRAAGQVNAAVGVDEAAVSEDRWLRLRSALFGDPFIISDSSERRLGLRAGSSGLLAATIAAVAAIVTVSWAFAAG